MAFGFDPGGGGSGAEEAVRRALEAAEANRAAQEEARRQEEERQRREAEEAARRARLDAAENGGVGFVEGADPPSAAPSPEQGQNAYQGGEEYSPPSAPRYVAPEPEYTPAQLGEGRQPVAQGYDPGQLGRGAVAGAEAMGYTTEQIGHQGGSYRVGLLQDNADNNPINEYNPNQMGDAGVDDAGVWHDYGPTDYRKQTAVQYLDAEGNAADPRMSYTPAQMGLDHGEHSQAYADYSGLRYDPKSPTAYYDPAARGLQAQLPNVRLDDPWFTDPAKVKGELVSDYQMAVRWRDEGIAPDRPFNLIRGQYNTPEEALAALNKVVDDVQSGYDQALDPRHRQEALNAGYTEQQAARNNATLDYQQALYESDRQWNEDRYQGQQAAEQSYEREFLHSQQDGTPPRTPDFGGSYEDNLQAEAPWQQRQQMTAATEADLDGLARVIRAGSGAQAYARAHGISDGELMLARAYADAPDDATRERVRQQWLRQRGLTEQAPLPDLSKEQPRNAFESAMVAMGLPFEAAVTVLNYGEWLLNNPERLPFDGYRGGIAKVADTAAANVSSIADTIFGLSGNFSDWLNVAADTGNLRGLSPDVLARAEQAGHAAREAGDPGPSLIELFLWDRVGRGQHAAGEVVKGRVGEVADLYRAPDRRAPAYTRGVTGVDIPERAPAMPREAAPPPRQPAPLEPPRAPAQFDLPDPAAAARERVAEGFAQDRARGAQMPQERPYTPGPTREPPVPPEGPQRASERVSRADLNARARESYAAAERDRQGIVSGEWMTEEERARYNVEQDAAAARELGPENPDADAKGAPREYVLHGRPLATWEVDADRNVLAQLGPKGQRRFNEAWAYFQEVNSLPLGRGPKQVARQARYLHSWLLRLDELHPELAEAKAGPRVTPSEGFRLGREGGRVTPTANRLVDRYRAGERTHPVLMRLDKALDRAGVSPGRLDDRIAEYERVRKQAPNAAGERIDAHQGLAERAEKVHMRLAWEDGKYRDIIKKHGLDESKGLTENRRLFADAQDSLNKRIGALDDEIAALRRDPSVPPAKRRGRIGYLEKQKAPLATELKALEKGYRKALMTFDEKRAELGLEGQSPREAQAGIEAQIERYADRMRALDGRVAALDRARNEAQRRPGENDGQAKARVKAADDAYWAAFNERADIERKLNNLEFMDQRGRQAAARTTEREGDAAQAGRDEAHLQPAPTDFQRPHSQGRAGRQAVSTARRPEDLPLPENVDLQWRRYERQGAEVARAHGENPYAATPGEPFDLTGGVRPPGPLDERRLLDPRDIVPYDRPNKAGYKIARDWFAGEPTVPKRRQRVREALAEATDPSMRREIPIGLAVRLAAGVASGVGTYAVDDDDDPKMRLAKAFAAGLGGYTFARFMEHGGYNPRRFIKGTATDLPGLSKYRTKGFVGLDALETDAQRHVVTTTTGGVMRSVIAHGVERKALKFGPTATPRQLEATTARLARFIDTGKGGFDPKTLESQRVRGQVDNLFKEVGAELTEPRVFDAATKKWKPGKPGDPSRLWRVVQHAESPEHFQVLFEAALDDVLVDQGLVGHSLWKRSGYDKAANLVKKTSFETLLAHNWGWAVENLIDRGFRSGEARTLGSLGHTSVRGQIGRASAALDDAYSGLAVFDPGYVRGTDAAGMGGLAVNPHAEEPLYARGKYNPLGRNRRAVMSVVEWNETAGKEGQYSVHAARRLTTGMARELGLESKVASAIRFIEPANYPLWFADKGRLAHLPLDVREKLLGVVDAREMRRIVVDAGLNATDARLVRDIFASHQIDAGRYALGEVGSSMRNYALRTNFDALLGPASPFHYWTTHNLVFTAKMAVKHPVAAAAVVAATLFMVHKNEDLPWSMKFSVRVPLRGLAEWVGEHGGEKGKELGKLINEGLDLAGFDEGEDPRVSPWGPYNAAIGYVARTLLDPEERDALKSIMTNPLAITRVMADMGYKPTQAWTLALAPLLRKGEAAPEWVKALAGENYYDPTIFGTYQNIVRAYLGATGHDAPLRAARKAVAGDEYSAGELAGIRREMQKMVKDGVISADEADRQLRERRGNAWDMAARTYFVRSGKQSALYAAGTKGLAGDGGTFDAEQRALVKEYAGYKESGTKADQRKANAVYNTNPWLGVGAQKGDQQPYMVHDNYPGGDVLHGQAPAYRKEHANYQDDHPGESYYQRMGKLAQEWAELAQREGPDAAQAEMERRGVWGDLSSYFSRANDPAFNAVKNRYFATDDPAEKRKIVAEHPELQTFFNNSSSRRAMDSQDRRDAAQKANQGRQRALVMAEYQRRVRVDGQDSAREWLATSPEGRLASGYYDERGDWVPGWMQENSDPAFEKTKRDFFDGIPFNAQKALGLPDDPAKWTPEQVKRYDALVADERKKLVAAHPELQGFLSNATYGKLDAQDKRQHADDQRQRDRLDAQYFSLPDPSDPNASAAEKRRRANARKAVLTAGYTGPNGERYRNAMGDYLDAVYAAKDAREGKRHEALDIEQKPLSENSLIFEKLGPPPDKSDTAAWRAYWEQAKALGYEPKSRTTGSGQSKNAQIIAQLGPIPDKSDRAAWNAYWDKATALGYQPKSGSGGSSATATGRAAGPTASGKKPASSRPSSGATARSSSTAPSRQSQISPTRPSGSTTRQSASAYWAAFGGAASGSSSATSTPPSSAKAPTPKDSGSKNAAIIKELGPIPDKADKEAWSAYWEKAKAAGYQPKVVAPDDWKGRLYRAEKNGTPEEWFALYAALLGHGAAGKPTTGYARQAATRLASQMTTTAKSVRGSTRLEGERTRRSALRAVGGAKRHSDPMKQFQALLDALVPSDGSIRGVRPPKHRKALKPGTLPVKRQVAAKV